VPIAGPFVGELEGDVVGGDYKEKRTQDVSKKMENDAVI